MMGIGGLKLTCLLLQVALLGAQQSPHFIYSQSNNKIMLSWSDVWEVGVSNKLAFLNRDKRLTIRINVAGDVGSGMRKILLCKCSMDSGAVEHIDLASVQPTTSYCDGTTPFTLKKLDDAGTEYQFTLMDSKLPYRDAFTQKIQLTVQVDYASDKILSNSLFVYNLDSISSFGATAGSEPSVVIDTFYKRYLTATAINFLIRMNMTSSPQFSSFQFIDPQMISLIASAPDFIRAKINIGAVLQFDAGDCQNFQSHLTSMFVNYHSKINDRNVNLLKHMGLSLDDGKLYYSTYGLSTATSKFFNERRPKEVGICTLTSFAGHTQPYLKVDEVKQRIGADQVSYAQHGSKTTECALVGGAASKSVSIFAGMDVTPLVCPIICADPNQPFKFFHGDRQLVPDSSREWTPIGGLQVSRAGNVIEFPAELFQRDSGEYRCEAGSQTFRYNAQIVAMPQFTTRLHDAGYRIVSGNLPQVIYAMENESLSYTCSVFYTNMDSVAVEPKFYSAAASGGSQSWTLYSLANFNKLLSSTTPVVAEAVTQTNESKTLNLTVLRVPIADSATYRNFTHRLVCNAFVAAKDAQKVGLPSYSVQSGSNVFFLKRPALKSFNRTLALDCSVQKCSNKKGAYFEVSLQPELAQQLRRIGVEVKAFWRIDRDYLSNIHIIKSVSVYSFNATTNALTFRVGPIDDDNILTEMQKHSSLTPVFNLRYNESSNLEGLQNLRIHKERHGAPDISAGADDCRADPLCFYSTDFDADADLRGLAIGLGFAKEGGEVPVAATASAGLIAGVTLAVFIIFVVVVLLVFLLRRDPGQSYLVDEKERQQGHNPELEVRDEQFKEYQRAEGPVQMSRRLSQQSNMSVVSRDDQELDNYRDDALDYTKFTEDGSFLGDYSGEDKATQQQQRAGKRAGGKK